LSTKRATILAALKTTLQAGVTAVSNRVYLPWDDQPETASNPLLQIEIADTVVDDSESIGQWLHTITLRIGAVKAGKFDYAATWDLLQAAATALAGSAIADAQRVDITGCADSVTVTGDRLLWPHLEAQIVYLTPAGQL
jgi:hypothetical protein